MIILASVASLNIFKFRSLAFISGLEIIFMRSQEIKMYIIQYIWCNSDFFLNRIKIIRYCFITIKEYYMYIKIFEYYLYLFFLMLLEYITTRAFQNFYWIDSFN